MCGSSLKENRFQSQPEMTMLMKNAKKGILSYRDDKKNGN